MNYLLKDKKVFLLFFKRNVLPLDLETTEKTEMNTE